MIETSLRATSVYSGMNTDIDTSSKRIRLNPNANAAPVSKEPEHTQVNAPVTTSPQIEALGLRANEVATDAAVSLAPEQINQLAESLNKNMQRFSRDIEFTVDHEHDQVIFRVIDRETCDVVRQIPREELLTLMEKMEEIQGLIFRDEV